MRLIVGLGNPGAQHARQRHNIGFMAVDRIASAAGLPWRARWQGLAAEGRIGAVRGVLLKPATFMNLSGQAVGEALRYLKLGPDALTVLHDELDLPPFAVRVKQGGGHAGHNGLRSIAAHVGPDFQRVRIGIGHPGHKDRVTPHVLGDFAKVEAEGLADLLDRMADAAPAIAGGDGAAIARALAPPAAPTALGGGTATG